MEVSAAARKLFGLEVEKNFASGEKNGRKEGSKRWELYTISTARFLVQQYHWGEW